MSNTSNSTCRLQSTTINLRQELSRILKGLPLPGRPPDFPPLCPQNTPVCRSLPSHVTIAVLTTQGPHPPARESASKGVTESPLSSWQQLLTQLKTVVTQMPGTKWTGTGAWPSSASGVRGASQCKGGTSDDEGLSALAE